jgi:hypothetical protein
MGWSAKALGDHRFLSTSKTGFSVLGNFIAAASMLFEKI